MALGAGFYASVVLSIDSNISYVVTTLLFLFGWRDAFMKCRRGSRVHCSVMYFLGATIVYRVYRYLVERDVVPYTPLVPALVGVVALYASVGLLAWYREQELRRRRERGLL
ncbi:hypothetical protein [Pyrodictium abyssi]|uniref:Uncharacterized protein n=1 Tax=Pyrodictium abyssi TaxID=54256 RepID=A0ABM8IZP8_9CREN|nr:hypothetical protein PABY_13450 [Pyrodictium abyssi]